MNVGSADAINVTDIAKIVMREMSLGDVALKFTDDNLDGRGWNGDVREFLLDCSLLRSLGWKPKRNSREAVKYTAQLYYQSTLKPTPWGNGWTCSNFCHHLSFVEMRK